MIFVGRNESRFKLTSEIYVLGAFQFVHWSLKSFFNRMGAGIIVTHDKITD